MFADDILFQQRFLAGLGLYDGKLDSVFGAKTSAALSKFEAISDEIANKNGQFDQRTEARIVTLHPKAQELSRKFMKAVNQSEVLGGVVIRIISGTRTYKEQADIFAQGRTKPGRIVTKAGPGHSNHNFGIAWDVGLFDSGDYLEDSPLYRKVGQIGKQIGLEWGGDWQSFPDEPHFQLRDVGTLADLRGKFEQGEPLIA
jgi:peptidoglycan L-alanyl-D-glutamate endopeptidase CwlK